MDVQERIARFENMAQADPDNEMAHFSLGQAYSQAGRHREAAEAFLRCVELAPAMSKAWQLAGEALVEAGLREQAIDTLTRGVREAEQRGDRMPAQAMRQLLESLGAPAPEPAQPTQNTPAAAGEGDFVCARTGMPGQQLPAPPFKGPLGQWIYENISAQTWRAWIAQGTKIINELRLDLSRDEDSAVYDRYMCEFLGVDDELLATLNASARPAPDETNASQAEHAR